MRPIRHAECSADTLRQRQNTTGAIQEKDLLALRTFSSYLAARLSLDSADWPILTQTYTTEKPPASWALIFEASKYKKASM